MRAASDSDIDRIRLKRPKKTHQSRPNVARRGLIAAAAVALISPHPRWSAHALADQNDENVIRQPAAAGTDAFMRRAFEMRQIAVDKGDQAYGAVIVLDGKIVGQSWSRVILDQDPTAHAEMAAIRDAARRLGRRDLSGTVMYSSSSPCPMCEAAAYWAGVGQLIHGNAMTDGGAPRLCG